MMVPLAGKTMLIVPGRRITVMSVVQCRTADNEQIAD
jgi:hypothetical protein